VKEYEVQINGLPHTLMLDAESVKQYPGAKAVESKQAKPANKAAAPKNK